LLKSLSKYYAFLLVNIFYINYHFLCGQPSIDIPFSSSGKSTLTFAFIMQPHSLHIPFLLNSQLLQNLSLLRAFYLVFPVIIFHNHTMYPSIMKIILFMTFKIFFIFKLSIQHYPHI